MSKIISIKAAEIIDSRGNPTLEVTCKLESGICEKASVPSGASAGVHEACELRDHDEKRYAGLGVLGAVSNVNTEISRHVLGKEFDQKTLDDALLRLDGTENKSRLGANAMLGVSLSFARAEAKEQKVELYEYLGGLAGNKDFKLPQPTFNVINGGKHADSGLDFQEFMLAPIGFGSFRRKVQAGVEVIFALKKILRAKGYAVSVGDEGGFAPKLASNEEAFEVMERAILDAGYSFDEIKIGIDAAASSFYKDGAYRLKIAGESKVMTSAEMVLWYRELVDKHPIIFIEDGLSEDDWEGFVEMTSKLRDRVKIVGDDLTVTNVKRIQTAIDKGAVNSVIIKPNQIGTLSETIEAIQLTKKQTWVPFVSHRSGDTVDTFIADLAVGLSCDFIKSGSLVRGERVCKYNRLMEIEDNING
ncbi:MAG: Enolase [Parcubacteria group bacterium GW2011_GWA2_47_16]|nr:MAG: Enolase [Parcubacteria group bacterium GW2011_GWA2_47_16]